MVGWELERDPLPLHRCHYEAAEIQVGAGLGGLAARTECVITCKTKVAGNGTVALPNRPVDSEAGGSGAAAAERPGQGPIRHGAFEQRANEFREQFFLQTL